MRTYTSFGGLVLFTAAACLAQTQVPLNTLPSRIVGHPQPETTTIASAKPNLVEGRELYGPAAVALDTSVTPPILYIADTNNNRVLAWKNALSFKNGQPADLIIGQQDQYHTFAQGPAGGSTAFQSGLYAPNGMVVDSNGSLYVADSLNNRILRYPKPFAQFAQNGSIVPDLWVGQPSIKSGAANFSGSVDKQGLNLAGSPFAINIALDAQNNLWVVDGGNRRVLRYPATVIAAGGGAPSVQADLVLGQVDFVSTNQPAPTSSNRNVPNAFAIPIGIAFDSKGNLYVTDSSTDLSVGRVLAFQPPFTIGQSATRIMGIPPAQGATNYTQDTLDRTVFALPTGTFFIPNASEMGVLDAYSSRILLFNTIDAWPDPSVSISPEAIASIGQQDCHSRGANANSVYTPAPSASTLAIPNSAVFYNGQLFVADSANNRVVVLPAASGTANCSQKPATLLAPATGVLGQDTFAMSAPNLIEGREFDFLTTSTSGTVADAGVAIDNSGATPHLYVADTYNNRILGYNDFRSLKAGAKADLVLGQPDFNSGLCNVTGNPNAPTASSLCHPTGLVVDSNGDLYVADTSNSRVLRFPAPFTHQGTLEQADLVLGQSNFTLSISDPTNHTMSAPYGLAIDGANALLVSDLAHNRVLYFPFSANGTFAAGTDNGKPATKVFGQQNFTSTASGNDSASFNAPHHIALDNEGRLYVADAGNSRVMIFDHIDSSTTSSTGARAAFQIAGLSQPRSVFVNQLTSEIWVGDTNSAGHIYKFPIYQNLILENPVTPASYVLSPGVALALAQDQYGDLIVADSTNRVGLYFPAVQAFNGASFLTSRPLAPGMLASLCSPTTSTYGCDPTTRQPLFGSNTAANSSLPNPLPLPTTLADTQVIMSWTQSDGTTYSTPVPLYYVSPGQINLVVPMGAPSTGQADLQVVQPSTGRVYADGPVAMSPYSPGILELEFSGGLRQAAVLNLADNTPNSPTNPAARGSYISIYAVGEGFVPNAPPDGAAVNGAVSSPAPVRVNIAGAYLDQMTYDSTSDVPQSQWMPYSGLNFYPGLWQINVYIPHAVAPNKQIPLIITVQGQPNTDPGTFLTYINVK